MLGWRSGHRGLLGLEGTTVVQISVAALTRTANTLYEAIASIMSDEWSGRAVSHILLSVRMTPCPQFLVCNQILTDRT